MAAHSDDPRVQRIVQRFETLSEADVARLVELYTADAYFKDPFNEVRGTAAIAAHLRAHVRGAGRRRASWCTRPSCRATSVFLTWDFLFRMKRFRRDDQCIRGGSHLVLTADGRIASHRDYWDAAEELYEKLPVLGGLMRWLKRRAAS